jgi:serine/threonine-protein kinase
MEHVSGRTLREVLDSQRRLSPETTAELLGPVADALDHAHHAGVVHLDVKPENLLLTSETVKVADFGLVRAAAQRGHAQALAATVHYCAPEVLRGGVVDGRADVYSLGVVAWECVTGRPPFEGDPRQVVQQHLGGRVPPPSRVVDGVPEPFDGAVARATDPDPTGRFLRASDFAAAMGAPRRRRVDETLRATTMLPPGGPDSSAGWAPAAGAAAVAAPAREAATQGLPGHARGAATRSLDGLPAGTGDRPAPPAGAGGLRPRPTTGRVPKGRRAERAKAGRGRVLAVLLVVGLLAVGVATRGGGLFGGSVRVPEVVGLEIPEATQDLQARGLRVRVGEPVASDAVHEGLVAAQSVAGGEQARRRTVVVLRPSLGITMPDLVRQPAGSATAKLRDLDIRFRQRDAASLAVAAGQVKQTQPAKGTVLKPDQLVTVVVSTGKPDVQVPDVAGQPAGAAEAALAAAHLRSRPEQVFDDQVPKDQVVGTDPAIGSQVTWGSTVVLRVSKGPDLVEVPDVTGLTRKEAEDRLRAAGLGWQYVLPVGGRVSRQRPGPGERAPRGSDVLLLLNVF